MATRCSLWFLPLLLLGGCFQQDNNKVSQILPLDRSSYVQVRSCRLNVQHGSKYIHVFANNSEAQQAYLAANCPLPQGSVIVAEESDKPDCSKITGYTLMFKDVPGYDPTADDWHWQQLDDQRGVLQDGRVQTCIECHSQCNLNDFTCSSP